MFKIPKKSLAKNFTNYAIWISFCILIALLPIQNLLVIFGVNLLKLPFWLTFWKEALVLFLIIALSLEVLWLNFQLFKINSSKKLPFYLNLAKILKSNLILVTSFFLVIWAFISSFWFNSGWITSKEFVYGFRFELWWLIFFTVSYQWLSLKKFFLIKPLLFSLKPAFWLGFSLVFLVSISSLIFGIEDFLASLGFSTNTLQIDNSIDSNSWNSSSLDLVISSPACHRIDYQMKTCRLSGGLSSPNFFAGYLLLFLPLVFSTDFLQIFCSKLSTKIVFKIQKFLRNYLFKIVLVSIILVFIFMSFARFSWIAIIFSMWTLFLVKFFQHFCPNRLVFIKKTTLILNLALPFFLATILLVSIPLILENPQLNSKLPTFLVKPHSSAEHHKYTTTATKILFSDTHKFFTGYGIPATGTAAKPEYTDLDTNYIYTNFSYLAINEGVFLMPQQNLILPENWFLQIFLNGGFFYGLAYLSLILIPVLGVTNPDKFKPKVFLNLVFCLSFLGILVGNLFLHLFENQTIALYWTLLFVFWKGEVFYFNNHE